MDNTAQRERILLPSADEITEMEMGVQCLLAGDIGRFEIACGDDGLVLRGRCHTYHAKQRAEDLVRQATRVPIVANEIEVS